LSTSMVTDEQGTPMAMVGVIRDITERKRAEEALKEQQIRLKEQLAFANALNRIAETVLTHDDTQAILENMARIVGETLGVDRSLIYDIDLSANMSFGLCEWDNQATPGIFPTKNNWNLDLFKNVIQHVMENKAWVESHADEINPLMIKDNNAELLHRRLGARSLLYYPFAFHPRGFYLLIFHQVSCRHSWRVEEIEFIDAVAKQVEIAVQKIHFLEERQQAQQEIWEEKERAQVTLQSIGDAVITTDALGNVEYLNPVAEDLTGWTKEKAKGLPLPQVFRIANENTGEAAENPVEKCIREGRIIGLANHTVLIHRDGHKFAIEESAAPIRNREGEIIGTILVFHDVSEKRSLLKQMVHQTYHDPLTGLPNRILFNDRLALALVQAQPNQDMLAVLFLDLDRFKIVNDMLGHAVGDRVLKEVAGRIKECLQKSDTIARLGGDEFTILLPRISHEEDAAKVAQKIIQAFQLPWMLGNQEFHITVSVGIALYPNDGDDAESLLKHADTAMCRAKDQGRNNYQLYTPAMNAKIMERLTMENSLRYALKRNEFTVFYQPQVNTASGQITGMEALVRWLHPDRGLVGPVEFIPLAEDTGLIIPIGEWVLHTACAQNKAWQESGLQPVRVTVNISACQFQQQNLVNTVAQALKQTGLDPQWLELEITESALMQDLDFTIKVLQDLRDMGVRISVDDFGTGYSSLNYLKRFPIHTLKIDRSFVRDITDNPEDAAIVSAIIVLAHNLNLNLIAEGVETPDQLAFLKHCRCCEMQGYLFSKPLPAGEFEKLLRHGKF
ncbi:MAG: EAL domain-containing protein, partial [Bacillota bacterium]